MTISITKFERRGNKLIPLRVIKERDPDRGGEYRTVRISEHRWPMKNTFSCAMEPITGDGDVGQWPDPPAPVTRAELAQRGLISLWSRYPRADRPVLQMTERDYMQVDREISGVEHHALPDDYLEFWQETGEPAQELTRDVEPMEV